MSVNQVRRALARATGYALSSAEHVSQGVCVIQHFKRPDGLPPVNGYSHVVAGEGRLIAVSGQLPIGPDGAIVSATDALAQARQVFTNLNGALRAADAGPQDVIRLTFFLTDLADLDAVRTARDEFFEGHNWPASSLVQVGRLVLPDARVEIDALAVRER